MRIRSCAALVIMASCASPPAPAPVVTPAAPVAAPPAPAIPSLDEALPPVVLHLAPPAPEKVVVAVFPFAERGLGPTLLGEYVADKLIAALSAHGSFDVLERSRLDTVRQEQALGVAGELDDATAASVGNLAGAEVVLVGTLTDLGNGAWELSVRSLGATDGRVRRTGEQRFAGGSLPPKLAGVLLGAPGPAASSKQKAGDACDGIKPWVGHVDAPALFQSLPRNNYFALTMKYGDNLWVETSVDGRAIPLCGKKDIVDGVELAPPNSTIYVALEDPTHTLQVTRRCWSYSEVTKKFTLTGAAKDKVSPGERDTGRWCRKISR